MVMSQPTCVERRLVSEGLLAGPSADGLSSEDQRQDSPVLGWLHGNSRHGGNRIVLPVAQMEWMPLAKSCVPLALKH